MDNRLTFLPNSANMMTRNEMRKKKLCSKLFFRVFTETKHGMREKQNDTFILFCFFAFIVLLWIFLEKEHELNEKQNDIFVMFCFFYFFGFSHKTI